MRSAFVAWILVRWEALRIALVGASTFFSSRYRIWKLKRDFDSEYGSYLRLGLISPYWYRIVRYAVVKRLADA